jgi:hypothetical protein
VASDLDPGTVYFANEPLFNVQMDPPSKHVASDAEGYFVDEGDMIATVSGTCSRTDPLAGNDTYVGRAYCYSPIIFSTSLEMLRLDSSPRALSKSVTSRRLPLQEDRVFSEEPSGPLFWNLDR